VLSQSVWRYVGRAREDGVVSILTADNNSLQELRLSLGGESSLVRHREEGGNDLACPGAGARLYNHNPVFVPHAAEGMWSPFSNAHLVPGASSSLCSSKLKDKLPRHNVEVLIISGMIVLRRTGISRREDANAAFIRPTCFGSRDETKHPFSGNWLRIKRRYSLVEEFGKAILAVIVEPGAFNGMTVLIECASRRDDRHLTHPITL